MTVEDTALVSEDGVSVCARCRVPRSPLGRMRGLLGRRSLASGEGMLFTRTHAVHTWFMRFSIDVAFLDVDSRVVRIERDVRPWRFVSCRGSRSTLELPAGEAQRVGLAPGMRLVFQA